MSEARKKAALNLVIGIYERTKKEKRQKAQTDKDETHLPKPLTGKITK